MELRESNIPGCYEVRPHIHCDQRGSLVKTFHAPTFQKLGLCTDFVEEYYSVSAKNVVRGMHFQAPPDDHVKLVYCTFGNVMDAVVDLRNGSPTYGQSAIFELSAEQANMVYIPQGLAHGFCALSEQTTMMYKVTTVYTPQSDRGIRWDSIGLNWPVISPIISSRDQNFMPFKEFRSPFEFKETQ